nr:glutathione synthetase [Quercus suber]
MMVVDRYPGMSHIELIVTQPKRPRAQHVPSSTNVSGLVETLEAAYAWYEQTIPGQTCILMVVQPDNFNIADERPIEYALWDHDVPCFRCEWQEVLEQTLCANDSTLLFCPPSSKEAFEVSVIYFRAGFEPSEYDSHGRETRLRLEASRAIKCPDILTHLTTSKAVQQALTQADNVDRFVQREMRAEINDTFVSILTMDDLEDNKRSHKQTM